jgi:hypothetical protein
MTTETEEEPTVTMDRLTKVYIKMRDKLSELTREYETAEAAIKAQQAEIASAMKDILQNAGGESMRTSSGTVALKTSTRYYIQDWEAMHRFIIDNDAAFLLEKRIAQKNMSDFLEQNPGTVPPSLNTMSELSISVTKPRK